MPNIDEILNEDKVKELDRERDILITEAGTTQQMRIWSKSCCERFKKYYKKYTQCLEKKDFKQALYHLYGAIGEFMTINDTAIFFNYPLLKNIKVIAKILEEDFDRIKEDYFMHYSFQDSSNMIMQRTLVSVHCKLLQETIRLYEGAIAISDQKGLKEKCYKWIGEHPRLAIAGGVVIGVAVGSAIWFLAPAALLKFGWITTEAVKTLTAVKIAGAVTGFGLITGEVYCVYCGNNWAKDIKNKRIYRNQAVILKRKIADFEKEFEEQKKLSKNHANKQKNQQAMLNQAKHNSNNINHNNQKLNTINLTEDTNSNTVNKKPNLLSEYDNSFFCQSKVQTSHSSGSKRNVEKENNILKGGRSKETGLSANINQHNLKNRI